MLPTSKINRFTVLQHGFATYDMDSDINHIDNICAIYITDDVDFVSLLYHL